MTAEQARVPEYRRIGDFLRSQLQRGELKPGAKIPSERELVERFGVAHMTVRQALDGLVREGLLVRRRGSGTFVARTRSVTRSANSIQSFTDDVQPAKAGARVIEQREIKPDEATAEHLELSGKGKVVELVRLRTVDDEPMAIHRVFIPVKICPGLVSESMEDRSLYEYLATEGIVFARAQQRIFAAAADQWQADLLNVSKGSPLLGGERVSRDARNIPVEYALSWSRPELSVWTEMNSQVTVRVRPPKNR